MEDSAGDGVEFTKKQNTTVELWQTVADEQDSKADILTNNSCKAV